MAKLLVSGLGSLLLEGVYPPREFFRTETGDFLLLESGDRLALEPLPRSLLLEDDHADTSLMTESGGFFLTETGDKLILE